MKKILFLLFAFCLESTCMGSHILGGEINYTQTSALTYKFRIRMYSDNASSADSPFLDLKIGTNIVISAFRIQKTDIGNGISLNLYETTYTFQGSGIYTVSLTEQNRGTLNNATNSISEAFYLQTTILVNPSISQITFESLASPILSAKAGTIFKTNLTNYSNVSTDSLSFQLYPCYGSPSTTLLGYQYPTGLTVNSISGELVWANPTQVGRFGIAVAISLWRNGVKISTMLRDFTIVVKDASTGGNEPVLASNSSIDLSNPNGTQVEAGQKITFRVIAHKTTPSPTQLEFYHPTLTATLYDSLDYRVAKFDWTPTLAQKQRQPYILTFRARGEYSLDKTILLYVGYPPQTPSFITALEETENKETFVRVFPNPTQDLLNIAFETALPQVVFEVFNSAGKVFATHTFNNTKTAQLSLQDLPKGIYFYKVLHKGNTIQQGKVIKE